MARAINRLTPMFVAKVKEPGRYADGGGLYLTTTNGGRRWVFLYRWRGKPVEMGLGSARDIKLARARELAAKAREVLAQGLSPLALRNAEVDATFGECADALIESMSPSWRNAKHVAQWKMTLLEYAGPLRPLSVRSIDTNDVLKVLTPIWTTKPETASRLRGRIERVLDAAKTRGFRSGENPARWRGHLDQVLPRRTKLSRGHHEAMPYADLPTFMLALRSREAPAARALDFLILTAARTSEVLKADWNEFDLDRKIWFLPAERMKTGIEHRVPLSPVAIDLLRRTPTDDRRGFVFPTVAHAKRAEPAPLSNMSMEMVLRRMKIGVTVHGFRSTFRDWAAETTGYPHEVCEMALAHAIPNKTEAAYRRGDLFEKRRRLMNDWADYCAANASEGSDLHEE